MITVLVLSLAATAVLVLSDNARWLRLGVVSALWSALVGAFLAAKYRRQAVAREEEASELQSIYELELEREVAARREYELEIEAETRRRIEEETSEHLEALRSELHALRENLEALLGGEVLVERVALRAESTRMRSLPDQSRVISVGDDRMAGTADRPRLTAGAGAPGQRPPNGERPTEFADRFPTEPSRPKEQQPRVDPTRREPARPEPGRPEPPRREPARTPPRQQPVAAARRPQVGGGLRGVPYDPPQPGRGTPGWPTSEPRQESFSGGLTPPPNGREPVPPPTPNEQTFVTNEPTTFVGPVRVGKSIPARPLRSDQQMPQELVEPRPAAAAADGTARREAPLPRREQGASESPAARPPAAAPRGAEPGRHGVDRETTGLRATPPTSPPPGGRRRRADDDGSGYGSPGGRTGDDPSPRPPTAPEPAAASEPRRAQRNGGGGAHSEGTSVTELLAAYGATTPRRHRRRAE
ncbi:DUF6779 domain-containing protein [Gandjariella thermophila]|uniref:DUF6779 domain-containing protein n=1 Tax=Gandjariella thermophila TaxID=1931992 RepID=A0A4D4J8E1_9PSEU|nr:DUF6779 domain-containing protein [Gandjariella thermophila]GDY30776.1 hypothetical protein GTS_24090 [Gandjariella thermophila]